jgi:hypothetical protein
MRDASDHEITEALSGWDSIVVGGVELSSVLVVDDVVVVISNSLEK